MTDTSEGIELFLEPPYEDTKRLYRDFDRNMAVILEVHAHAGRIPSCKRGCDACCHQLVLSTVAEARIMAEALADLPDAKRQRLWTRLEEWRVAATEFRRALQQPGEEHLQDLVETLAEEYWARRIPCPFLVDRACALHDARPLACRQHHSLGDPVHCGNGSDAHIEQLEAMEDLFFMAQDLIPGDETEMGIFQELVIHLTDAKGA